MSTTRKPERDYSHRSLLDKLGVAETSKVAVVNLRDRNFLDEVRKRTRPGRLQKDSDLIFYEANSRSELARLKQLRKYLKSNGAIWVISFKGKQARIRDIDVITAAKKAGLVDNKVVGFSETHTSLRLVIPRNQR